VLSEVPLQPGQKLQLAVSQTPQGVRLQIVGRGCHRPQPERRPEPTASMCRRRMCRCRPAAGACADISKRSPFGGGAERRHARQGSLSPLFAILGVAMTSPACRRHCRAAARLLAQRTPLTENLTGDALKTAFQKSGLEQGLASSQGASVRSRPR
jgi:hypothetical protein